MKFTRLRCYTLNIELYKEIFFYPMLVHTTYNTDPSPLYTHLLYPWVLYPWVDPILYFLVLKPLTVGSVSSVIPVSEVRPFSYLLSSFISTLPHQPHLSSFFSLFNTNLPPVPGLLCPRTPGTITTV